VKSQRIRIGIFNEASLQSVKQRVSNFMRDYVVREASENDTIGNMIFR
jgi:hypothetical protein